MSNENWRRDYLAEVNHQDRAYPPGYDHYPDGGNAWPENVADIPRVSYIPAH